MSKSKIFLVFNFLFFVSFFEVNKAEINSLNISNPDDIEIEYLNPSNVLEDYIIDTGDALLINFINRPRGFENIEKKIDVDDISYLNPRSSLENYILDTGDTVSINFIFVPEFSSSQKINLEGEIMLPEIGTIYIKGLNINQLENLLEKKYVEFLKSPEIEVGIDSYRFIKSGIYPVNANGEIILPYLNEVYVRGLTTNEISNLLSRKYLQSELIYAEVKTKISTFKPQRILISGEVRNPGIYKFQGFDSKQFGSIEASPSNPLEDKDNLVVNGKLSEKTNLEISKNRSTQNNFAETVQIKRQSEKFTTISNAILRAGGITSFTDLSRIEIIRDVPLGKGGGKKKAVIDFTSFLNESDVTNDIRLFDGDRLIFPKSLSKTNDQIPKSILSGISPKFISVNLFGRVESPGIVRLPLESALSDAIDLSGPIKPLSGKIVLIRYNKDGTILKQNISYSARAKRGSRRNPFLKANDLISVKNSFLGKTSGVLKEITAPFVGIYTTKEIFESFSD